MNSSIISIFYIILLTQSTSMNQQDSAKQYKKIQNYIIKFSDLIGEGNFSTVYKAHHQITKQVVAIKIIDLNKLNSKMLLQLLFSQIDILKKLNHPNILKFYQAFTSNRNCYIVTELCNQGDLQTKLKTTRCMKENEAQPYIRDVFKGLIYLANNSIVHRDIKIANIFLHNGQAKIADFGFAKFTKTKFKDSNIGSPIYMSPEGLINHLYGPKTDIWAFGILVYQLLHGETPFSHSLSEKDLKRSVSIPITARQLKELSADIKEVIMRCLQVDEQTRISAHQLRKLNYFINNDANRLLRAKLSVKHPYALNFAQILPEKIKIQQRYQINMSLQQNKSPKYSQGQFKPYYFEKTSIINQKKINNYPSNQYLSQTQINFRFLNKNISLKQPPFKEPNTFLPSQILSVPINFNQCVKTLNYCRLLFKYLEALKQTNIFEEKQILLMQWLFVILKAIHYQTQQKRVQSQGNNHKDRQKKLNQVIIQYIHKYTKQMHMNQQQAKFQNTSLNYREIYHYFLSAFQKIDHLVQKYSINKQLLYLGHSIVLICLYTKIMNCCYEQQNYIKLQKINEIEEFLSMSKEKLDMPSYQWYKKKNWMGISIS